MAKGQRHSANDTASLLDGENLTAEQLDVASIEMLKTFSDFGLAGSSRRGGNWRRGNKPKCTAHAVATPQVATCEARRVGRGHP
jgi:hypothetical protein